MAKRKTTGRNGDRRTLADKADKYRLYQKSVQEPEHEVEFFDKVFRARFKRSPQVLREDFCGTFAICCEWARKRGRTAVGVDLDCEPLDWGREHNLSKLSDEARKRVKLLQEDVRSVGRLKANVLAAQNFSFWIFKTRQEVLEYFQAARKNLAREGLMVLDMMGGGECFEEDHRDVRNYRGFKYVWEQARFDPVTHDASFYIHFRFKDGSAMRRAFEYHWRFWSVPEITELLKEAGFSEVDVYWEGTDEKTGEGNDEWKKATSAASEPSWIAYIVAVK
jgi:hypothetical protein